MDANSLPSFERNATHLVRAAAAAPALAILLALIIVTTPAAQAQAFKVIYSFTGGADGAHPSRRSSCQYSVASSVPDQLQEFLVHSRVG